MAEPNIVLEPGERMLWSGRPQRIALTGPEWCCLAFGAVLVVVVFAAHGMPFMTGPVPLTDVAVVLCGIAVTWVPVGRRLWVTRRAVYVVTGERIVVADRVTGRTRASEYRSALAPAVVRVGRDGTATLTFTRRDAPGDALGVPMRKRLPAIRLFAVPADEQLRVLTEPGAH
ncbi:MULTISPECIES: hypothetical protein [Amycolatopsis]|uniref:DUF304 domain-containing protein n=1 Tax=Amycolatopsis bullii TaxID=941987 RepID=A0ABQ3L0C5_9PSEU|nr:hypothetical protein [Amycolatopsis bullii]GHG48938.1 hypothetical protein GCM10017567_84490 [Amycolatopsis bullii]